MQTLYAFKNEKEAKIIRVLIRESDSKELLQRLEAIMNQSLTINEDLKVNELGIRKKC